MSDAQVLAAEVLGEDCWLDLESFARACAVEPAFVMTLVEQALIVPAATEPQWRFGGGELARARRIRRLQHDFEASLDAVAVMLDLLDEIERLRAELHRHTRR
jgi:chaperone modulatory protein CbpM